MIEKTVSPTKLRTLAKDGMEFLLVEPDKQNADPVIVFTKNLEEHYASDSRDYSYTVSEWIEEEACHILEVEDKELTDENIEKVWPEAVSHIIEIMMDDCIDGYSYCETETEYDIAVFNQEQKRVRAVLEFECDEALKAVKHWQDNRVSDPKLQHLADKLIEEMLAVFGSVVYNEDVIGDRLAHYIDEAYYNLIESGKAGVNFLLYPAYEAGTRMLYIFSEQPNFWVKAQNVSVELDIENRAWKQLKLAEKTA